MSHFDGIEQEMAKKKKKGKKETEKRLAKNLYFAEPQEGEYGMARRGSWPRTLLDRFSYSVTLSLRADDLRRHLEIHLRRSGTHNVDLLQRLSEMFSPSPLYFKAGSSATSRQECP